MTINRQKRPQHQPPRTQIPTWVSIAILLIIAAIYLYQQWNAADIPPPTTIASASSSSSSQRSSASTASGQSSGFDFYILVLSWSPDYCATSGNDDPQQCSIGKKLGFVLHGLWPQYERGYPSNCSNVKLPDSVQAKFPGLFPSQSLYDHEWEKHGTCTGLTPEQYLALSKQLKESVSIPAAYHAPEQPFRTTTAQLKKDIAAANPSVSESTLAVGCSGAGRFLQELQVCFSLAGKPTTCSREVQNDAARSCQSVDFLVRNVK